MFSMRTGVVCDLKIIINPWQIDLITVFGRHLDE